MLQPTSHSTDTSQTLPKFEAGKVQECQVLDTAEPSLSNRRALLEDNLCFSDMNKVTALSLCLNEIYTFIPYTGLRSS